MIEKKYPAFFMRQVENETRNLACLVQWFSYLLEDMIVDKKNFENEKLFHQIEHSPVPVDYVNIVWTTDADALEAVKNNLDKTIDSSFSEKARHKAELFISYKMLRKQRYECRFWQFSQKQTLETMMRNLHVTYLDYGDKIAIAKASIASTMCDADFKFQFMEYAKAYKP